MVHAKTSAKSSHSLLPGDRDEPKEHEKPSSELLSVRGQQLPNWVSF
jgi:hypothetical protein